MTTLRAGSRFADRYVIERELGHGGSAEVYLAHDEQLPKRVAIKVLQRSIASQVVVERFLREIRIAARLLHPNIVQLHDAGEWDGLPYFTMTYVEGETLRARLEKHPRQPLSDSIGIVTAIADALEYAHAAGIVHRDIKPENILFFHGKPIVADFGIAKAVSVSTEGEGGATITSDNLVIGTPQYMSPEQQLGEERLDGRSDIYSLATVLYEMLTGTVPLGGRTFGEILAIRLTETPRSVTAERGDVSAALEAVIMRALEREPAHRYATAREFSVALSDAGVTTESRKRVDDRPSIAVLPFRNVPADPEREYFSVGITDGVSSALSRQRRLRVVARTSVFAYTNAHANANARELAREFDADWLVEGALIKRNGSLRISVNLVNSEGLAQPVKEFNKAMAEAIQMQDEIAQSIADDLSPSLLGAAPPVASAMEPEVYARYLLARRHWSNRTPKEVAKAAQLFQEVIKLAPDSARGYAGMADVQNSRFIYGYARPSDLLASASDAARKAIELDPFAAEPHAALGNVRAVLDYDWAEAAAEYRRAIALDPTYSAAYGWLANYVLLPQARFDEAMAELGRARAVEPVSAHIGSSIGMTHYYARRFDDAIRECRAVLEYDDDYLVALYFEGRSLVETGRFDEAIAVFKRMSSIAGGHPYPVAETGYAHAKRGDRAAAQSELNMLRAMSSDRYVSSCQSALVHAALGNVEEALTGIERGFDEHSTDLLWLGVHPGLDSLRAEPRFQTMLRRLRLA